MQYPTEQELLEFFWTEPTVEGDVHTYILSDASGLELVLSFNIADDSLQTLLRLGGRIVSVVCYEFMTRFWIRDSELLAEFVYDGITVTATVSVRPYIEVRWSGLRTD